MNTGDHYQGAWINGKPEGQGVLTGKRNGNFKYVGEFKNGGAHGIGTFTEPGGYKYVGEWKDDKRHGQGTETYADGTKYVGEYRDGNPQTPELDAAFKQYRALNKQGKYAEATPFAQTFLELAKKEFGATHRHYATGLNILAGLYVDQGRYADAEPLYKRSLAIDEKALGPDHPDVATVLNNLARL